MMSVIGDPLARPLPALKRPLPPSRIEQLLPLPTKLLTTVLLLKRMLLTWVPPTRELRMLLLPALGRE